ncbi:hypothetical protein [Actinoplanes sp. NPDC051494]|uniref:hypothetical protein n=1 Tax=Actinoplanes sp. NPDC051494 TaxID=3363907 RepID=UPI003791F17F
MRLRRWVAAAGVLTAGLTGVVAGSPAASAAVTTIIDDTSPAVTYSGTWPACVGNCARSADGSFRWTQTTNSYLSFSFTGNQVVLYGMKEPQDNIATVAIDGATPVDVDYYASPASTMTVPVWTSPTLTDTTHTLKLSFTPRHSHTGVPAGNSITFDKAVVTSGTTPPSTGSNLSGLPWNSGVGPQPQTSGGVVNFQQWRGAPVDDIVLFPARDNWSTLLSTDWITDGIPTGWDTTKGDLVATIPLWPGSNNVSNTGSETQWRQLADHIATGDPNAYVRLGWEMNIASSYWMIGDGTRQDYNGVTIANNKTAWKNSFIKAAAWIKDERPDLRIVWNPNYGDDQTCNSCSRAVFQAAKQYLSVYAIDTYDSWAPDRGTSGTTAHLNRLKDTRDYAAQSSMKWAVPEWGVACNENNGHCQWHDNAGGDNPQYIHDYLTFFRDNASTLAFEAYFDEPAAYIRSALDVTPIGPNAPAKYQSDIAAYKTS